MGRIKAELTPSSTNYETIYTVTAEKKFFGELLASPNDATTGLTISAQVGGKQLFRPGQLIDVGWRGTLGADGGETIQVKSGTENKIDWTLWGTEV